jgi:hypothetical protein
VRDIPDCQGAPGSGAGSAGGFKLLATGKNYTRVAEHRMSAEGLSTWLHIGVPAISYNNTNQKIDTLMSPWPSESIQELVLVVRNWHIDFCVGGRRSATDNAPQDFNFQTSGGGYVGSNVGTAFCVDPRVGPTSNGNPTHSYIARNNISHWIRPVFNRNYQTMQASVPRHCRASPSSSYPQRQADSQNPGVYGVKDFWRVTCHYSLAAGDWTGNLTNLVIQEVTGANISNGAPSTWDWELYYR